MKNLNYLQGEKLSKQEMKGVTGGSMTCTKDRDCPSGPCINGFCVSTPNCPPGLQAFYFDCGLGHNIRACGYDANDASSRLAIATGSMVCVGIVE